jgi:hypothetical protein
MLAFEVEIDGKREVCAGVADWTILGFYITAVRHEPGSKVRDGYIETQVGGLTVPDDSNVRHHFRWQTSQLKVGSVVSVRIVDVPTADAPSKRYRSDQEVQESALTEEEMRELRYKDYLELKAEFENNDEAPAG